MQYADTNMVLQKTQKNPRPMPHNVLTNGTGKKLKKIGSSISYIESSTPLNI